MEARSPALSDPDAGPIPDFAEPLEAWRVWRVARRGGRVELQSLFSGAVWIYGVQSVAAARSYLELPPLLFPNDRVIGRVALWGDVVEGPAGWRASHAYPSELYVPSPSVAYRGLRQRARLDEILFGLEAYGVPVDLVAPSELTGYSVRA